MPITTRCKVRAAVGRIASDMLRLNADDSQGSVAEIMEMARKAVDRSEIYCSCPLCLYEKYDTDVTDSDYHPLPVHAPID